MNRFLLIEGLLLSLLITVAVRYLSYRRLSLYFGHPCRMVIASTLPSSIALKKAALIARRIQWVVSKTPWTLSCLAQALLAKRWCQREKIPYFLFIGLAKDKKLSEGVEGHAWLMVGPYAVTGGNAFDTHHVISSYSNQDSFLYDKRDKTQFPV